MPTRGTLKEQQKLYHYVADVTAVYDGDTITVDLDLGLGVWRHDQTIRLWKIDTPELHGPDRDRGLVVVGLSNEQAHEVDADLQKHPCAHPTAIVFYSGYTVKLIPLTILIDKDGKVAWRGRSEDLKE